MQLDPTVKALLDRQIGLEHYAQLLYLAANAWADANAFEGLAAWALGEAQDEAAHARMFLEYANQRGQATILAVPQPPAFATYDGVLSTLLSAEQTVSAALRELRRVADAADDPETALKATQQLLDEQVPAEHRLQQALLKVRRASDLDLLDAELWEGDAG